jgi:ribosome-binding protein aMBF1 (putative translation factor)
MPSAVSSPRHQPPCAYRVDGQWPHARLRPHRGAYVAQEVARRLAQAMGQQGLSASRLAVRSGVNRQTITNVLGGLAWPDLLTVALLEEGLDSALWPPYECSGTTGHE